MRSKTEKGEPVADETPSDSVKARASELVRRISEQGGNQVTDAQRGTLTDAVAHDLSTVSNTAAAEERLVKIETQTRVLAEAVIAIAETADMLALAVKAVKDEM